MLLTVHCMQLANCKVKSGIGQKYRIAIVIRKKSACHKTVCVHLSDEHKINELMANLTRQMECFSKTLGLSNVSM